MRDNQQASKLSRRAVIASLAAGAAANVPAIAGVARPAPSPAATESPELLAFGAKVETQLSAYRAAAPRLAEARAIAAALWPDPPPQILVNRRDRDARYLFEDCYQPEVDFEGEEVWPEPFRVDGRLFGMPPRDVLRSAALSQFLAEVRADPDHSEDDAFARDLLDRLQAAERYEAACAYAIEASGIEQAKLDVEASVRCLRDLLLRVRGVSPRTVAGVVIVARALVAFNEVQKDGHLSSGQNVSYVDAMNTALAEAVLRIAGENGQSITQAA